MPLVEISAENASAGIVALDPDLDYLLTDRGVSKPIRAILGHFGVTRLNVFAKIEGTEDTMRAWIAKDLGLKREDVMNTRIMIAKIIDAWEAARDRVAKQTAFESEARAAGLPRQTLKSAHLALRTSFKGRHDEIKGEAYSREVVHRLEAGTDRGGRAQG
ncbi:MAG: hypothetical protein NXI07_15265 [bacterium]|nr:hypothetical protein [bacterium]